MKKITLAVAVLAYSFAAIATPNSGAITNKFNAKKVAAPAASAEAPPLINNDAQEQLAFENMMNAMFRSLGTKASVPASNSAEVELNQLRGQNQLLTERIQALQDEVAFNNMMTAAFLQSTAIATPKHRNRR
jgi:hypothetical protein